MFKRLILSLSLLSTLLMTVPARADSTIPPVQRLGTGIPTSIAASPDGKTLAVGSSIGVWLLDSITLEPVDFIQTDAWVDKVSYSEDGYYLKLSIRPYNASSGTMDVLNVAIVWFFDTEQDHPWNELRFVNRHVKRTEAIVDLRTKLVSASPEASLAGLIWQDHSCDLHHSLCATAQVDSYVVIDQNTKITISFFPDLTAKDVALSPDGAKLFGLSQGDVSEWDVYAGTLLNRQSQLFTGTLLQVRWSVDGSSVVSAESSWNVKSAQASVISAVWGCSWYRVQECDSASMAAFNSVYRFDPITGQQVQRIVPHQAYLMAAKLNRDHSLLVTSGEGDNCFVFDGKDCATVWTSTRIWRYEDFALLAQLPILFRDVEFSSDNNLLIGKTTSGIEVWNWKSGQRLWSGDVDAGCQYWSTLRFLRFHTYERDRAEANCIAVSSKGDYIATFPNFSGTPVVHIWKVDTGDLVATLTGHNSEITGVAFSPDGTQIAASSLDGTILVWNVP